MIGQLNIYGKDKVQTAIDRIKAFEPQEGYYLAFSGGKDSVVIKALADMAGVKYEAHYNLTSVDPPELVRFVQATPGVEIDKPRDKEGNHITMWNLIAQKKMPPTRLVRYCCEKLKESQGHGRFVITGVRKEESAKRSARGGVEISDTKTGQREMVDPDNPNQEMVHICQTKAQRILNPIIDWDTSEVWEFIRKYNIPYCGLYDKGYKRLGCIGCPMSYRKAEELKQYPKYKRAYLKAFERMIAEREKAGLETKWKTGEEVMEWWVNE